MFWRRPSISTSPPRSRSVSSQERHGYRKQRPIWSPTLNKKDNQPPPHNRKRRMPSNSPPGGRHTTALKIDDDDDKKLFPHDAGPHDSSPREQLDKSHKTRNHPRLTTSFDEIPPHFSSHRPPEHNDDDRDISSPRYRFPASRRGRSPSSRDHSPPSRERSPLPRGHSPHFRRRSPWFPPQSTERPHRNNNRRSPPQQHRYSPTRRYGQRYSPSPRRYGTFTRRYSPRRPSPNRNRPREDSRGKDSISPQRRRLPSPEKRPLIHTSAPPEDLVELSKDLVDKPEDLVELSRHSENIPIAWERSGDIRRLSLSPPSTHTDKNITKRLESSPGLSPVLPKPISPRRVRTRKGFSPLPPETETMQDKMGNHGDSLENLPPTACDAPEPREPSPAPSQAALERNSKPSQYPSSPSRRSSPSRKNSPSRRSSPGPRSSSSPRKSRPSFGPRRNDIASISKNVTRAVNRGQKWWNQNPNNSANNKDRKIGGRRLRNDSGGTVQRKCTCPFLLPVYVTGGGEDVDGEVHIYAWKDSGLREITNLIKDVVPESRNAKLKLKLVPHCSKQNKTQIEIDFRQR